MNVLGIIIARGGSKGLPKKNTKKLLDKPLIAWSIIEAKKSKTLDKLILSTEDDEITNIGHKYEIDIPFKRKKELATDDAHTPDILINALQELEKIETKKYDIVVLLQPTVPFRRADHIDNAVNSFKSSNFDSLITVQKQDYPPWWMFQLKNKKLIQSFKYKNNINVFNLERQQFPEVYKPNGSVYVTWVDSLKKNNQLVNPDNCGYLIIDDEFQINIDTQLDFITAESIAKLRLK